MSSGDFDPAKQAVEKLAALVGAPLPPRGLRIGGRKTPAWRKAVWVVAVGVLAAAGTGILVLRGHGGAGDAGLSRDPRRPAYRQRQGVIVEHLRLGGREVAPKVLDLPDADAVLVMSGDPPSPRSEAAPVPEGTFTVALAPHESASFQR